MKHYNPNLSDGEPVSGLPRTFSKFPAVAAKPEFLRVRDIVRPHGILPIGKSTWHLWVQTGRAPAGIRINGVTMWARQAVLAFAHGESN